MEYLEFEYINGFRSNSKLAYTTDEKQIYKKNNNYNNGSRYICYHKNCDVSVFIDDLERCRKLGKDTPLHQHPNQEAVKDKMLLSQKIKNACKNAATTDAAMRDIFDEECRNAKDAANLVEYEKMKRNLYRLKKSQLQTKETPHGDVQETTVASTPEDAQGTTVASSSADRLSITDPVPCKKTKHAPTSKSTKEQVPKAKELLEFEYINGFRSSSVLVYTKDEKHIYKKHNSYNNGRRYECYHKNCSASIFIDAEERCWKLNAAVLHNHDTQEALKDKMLVSQKIKNACKNAASIKDRSTREIFEEALRNEKNAANLVEYQKMKRNLCHIKKRVLQNKEITVELRSCDSERIVGERNLTQAGEGENVATAMSAMVSKVVTPTEDVKKLPKAEPLEAAESNYSDEEIMSNYAWPAGDWQSNDTQYSMESGNGAPAEEPDAFEDVKLFKFEQIDVWPKDPLSAGGDTLNMEAAGKLLVKTPATPEEGDFENNDSNDNYSNDNYSNDNYSNDHNSNDLTITKYELTEPDTTNKPFLEFEYINGFRSSSKLVYSKDEKQIYKKNNNYNNGSRYACYHKKCRASIFVDNEERCRRLKGAHNHPTQELLKQKMQISQKIKDACKNESLKRRSTRDIFEEECRNEDNAAYLVQFNKMRRNLYRIKKSLEPKKAKTGERSTNKDEGGEELEGMSGEQSRENETKKSIKAKREPVAKETKPQELLEFEYINGFRSSSMLVYTKDEKHIYKKHNNYNNGIRYTCYSKKCGGSIFIDDQEKCRRLKGAHNHPTQELLKDKMLVSQKIKNACKNATEKANTRVIFEEALRDEQNAAAKHLVDYAKMRANLSRIKRKALPKAPITPEQLNNTDLEALMPKHKLSKNDPKIPEYFEYEYINGFRSSSLLVYTKDEKQIYRRNNVYNKGKRYVCYSKNCPVAVLIDKHERCRRLSELHAHNHPTQELLKDKMFIRHKIKNAAKNATQTECTAREVFEAELRDVQNAADLIDFTQIKRTICFLKNRFKPKVPRVPKDPNAKKKSRKRKPKPQPASTDLNDIDAEMVETSPDNNQLTCIDLTNIGSREATSLPNNTRPMPDFKIISSEVTRMPFAGQPTATVITLGTEEARPPCNNPWLSADIQNIGADNARLINNYYNQWQWQQGGAYHR